RTLAESCGSSIIHQSSTWVSRRSGGLIPNRQLVVRNRTQNVAADSAPKRPRFAALGLSHGYGARVGLARLSNDHLFARGRFLEQLRKFRLGFVNIRLNCHSIRLGQSKDAFSTRRGAIRV